MARTPHIAYFCMEYGLHDSFPIYAGGLGVLAGDYIKAAKDLELPVAGVGLRWERGYGSQRITADGKPVTEFPSYDARFLEDTGVHVRVRIRGEEIPCNVLKTERFGHVPLYLIEPSRAKDRWITHRLYEAGTDIRIAQEMLLGIGGIRALNWLTTPFSTYHFNEGHAVFAGIEMIAERMERGMSFPAAWEDTRRKIVFTTHTPVKAGNEEHALKDLRRMDACLQLSGAEMRAIGGDPFNMTVAGLRLARGANAVSKLHGETAREMWAHVDNASPITSITNGVHMPTWQSERIAKAVDDDGALWEAHCAHKAELIAEAERRTGSPFDPNALFVGFARRATAYKRADLIFRDEERLKRLFERHPIVFVFAGKSHPDDKSGKAMVSRLVEAQKKFAGRVVFMENYELQLGRLLTRGCDVWLNNPIRPLEASGTSGMKAAANGLLNCSILDGWWPEGCEHGVNGWAISDSNAGNDEKDMVAIYESLENEVLPAWSDRDRWIRMMRASIKMATERFSARRMVKDYFEKLYSNGGIYEPGSPGPSRVEAAIEKLTLVEPGDLKKESAKPNDPTPVEVPRPPAKP